MGIGVTDEIFGIAIAQNTPLDPMYNVGAMSVACPGWVLGTALGGIMGEILPSVVKTSDLDDLYKDRTPRNEVMDNVYDDFELYGKLQEGLDDVAAGRTRPLEDVISDLRSRRNFR